MNCLGIKDHTSKLADLHTDKDSFCLNPHLCGVFVKYSNAILSFVIGDLFIGVKLKTNVLLSIWQEKEL